MPQSYHIRASDSTSRALLVVQKALIAALTIIESELPEDAEVRLFAAREVARLLASGVLARMQL